MTHSTHLSPLSHLLSSSFLLSHCAATLLAPVHDTLCLVHTGGKREEEPAGGLDSELPRARSCDRLRLQRSDWATGMGEEAEGAAARGGRAWMGKLRSS
jgi:hypothetical protein